MVIGSMVKTSVEYRVKLFSHPLTNKTIGLRLETGRMNPDQLGIVVDVFGPDVLITCPGGIGWVFSRNLQVVE